MWPNRPNKHNRMLLGHSWTACAAQQCCSPGMKAIPTRDRSELFILMDSSDRFRIHQKHRRPKTLTPSFSFSSPNPLSYADMATAAAISGEAIAMRHPCAAS